MFHERETTTRVIPINHKSDASTPEAAGFAVQRPQNSICCVRFSWANEIVSRHDRWARLLPGLIALNDFVLSGGGKNLQLLSSDIDGWHITFVDTGPEDARVF